MGSILIEISRRGKKPHEHKKFQHDKNTEKKMLQLEPNLGGDEFENYYIHIEGTASKELDILYKYLETLGKDNKLHMVPINSQITCLYFWAGIA